VQKAPLKLKGVAEGGGVAKKSKKKKSKDRDREEEKAALAAEQAAGTSAASSSSPSSVEDQYLKGKTKSEISFLKRKERRDEERLKQKASVSHKERVEKFNEYLNNLSEHYEPAKVSWTK